MAKPTLTIICVGIVLSALFGKVAFRDHDYTHDGRQLYVASRLLAAGDNPYDEQQLRAGYNRFTYEGHDARKLALPQIHPPATLFVLMLVSWMPWRTFCLLEIVVMSFCIPLIVHLCLKYFYAVPPTGFLWLGSLGVAVIPPTWQNVALGQIALPITLCLLLAVRFLQQRQYGQAVLVTLLSLLKFTCGLPLLLYLFLKGDKPQRIALAAGAALYLCLNLIAISHIGPTQFMASYRRDVRTSFTTENSTQGSGQGARMDLDALLAAIPSKAASASLKAIITLALVAGFFWRFRQNSEVTLAHVSALSMLALLLFYHRTYDAVLFVPSLFVAAASLAGSRTRGPGLTLAVLLCLSLAAIGNGDHNLVNFALNHIKIAPPPYLKALFLLMAYCVFVFTGQVSVPRNKETCVPRRPAVPV